jgi:hypothetical protein
MGTCIKQIGSLFSHVEKSSTENGKGKGKDKRSVEAGRKDTSMPRSCCSCKQDDHAKDKEASSSSSQPVS